MAGIHLNLTVGALTPAKKYSADSELLDILYLSQSI